MVTSTSAIFNNLRVYSPRNTDFESDISYDGHDSDGSIHYKGKLTTSEDQIRIDARLYGSGLIGGSKRSSQVVNTPSQIPITVMSFAGGKGLSTFYEDWRIALVGISLKDPDNEAVWNELRFTLPGAYWFRTHSFHPEDWAGAEKANSEEPEIFHTFSLDGGFELDFCRKYSIVDDNGQDEVFFNLRHQEKFSLNDAQRAAIYPLQALWGFAFQQNIHSILLSGVSDNNVISIYDLENPSKDKVISKFQGPFFSWMQEYFDNYERLKRSIHLVKNNSIGSVDLISALSGLISEIEPISRKLDRPQTYPSGELKSFKDIVCDFSSFIDLKSLKKMNNWQLRVKQHRDYLQHGDESTVNLVEGDLKEALALWLLLKMLFFKAFWTKYVTDPDGIKIWKYIEESEWGKQTIKGYEANKHAIKKSSLIAKED